MAVADVQTVAYCCWCDEAALCADCWGSCHPALPHLVDVVDKATCQHVAASWPLLVAQGVEQLPVAATDYSNLGQQQGT